MKKWEYLAEQVNAYKEPEVLLWAGAETINDLGKEGWELVSAVKIKSDGQRNCDFVCLYFKREIE